MARKTKKMKTEIQSPVLNSRGNRNPISTASTTETADLDALLASVLRVFAARGRAIREAREKQQVDRLQNNGT